MDLGTGFLTAVKLVEYSGLIFLSDSWAGVAEKEGYAALGGSCLAGNRTAGSVVADGIIQQIDQHAADLFLVGMDGQFTVQPSCKGQLLFKQQQLSQPSRR